MVATLVEKAPIRDKSSCPPSAVDIALNIRFVFDTSDESIKLYREILESGLNFSIYESNGLEGHPLPALHDEPFWYFGHAKIRKMLPFYLHLVESGRLGNSAGQGDV